ncbi:uncharacterized protein LOC115089761 isoform X2 [Rhinatrema bivittatum]|nr:uncharacterized protein LOC115089761 isoform X2 [Rhinatrema bivittatum]
MKVILVCLCLITQAYEVPKENNSVHSDTSAHQLDSVDVPDHFHKKKHHYESAAGNVNNVTEEIAGKESKLNSRNKPPVDCDTATGTENLVRNDPGIVMEYGAEGSGNSDFLDNSHKGITFDVTSCKDFSLKNKNCTDPQLSQNGKEVDNGVSKDMRNDLDDTNKMAPLEKGEHARTSQNPNNSKKGEDARSIMYEDHHDVESTPHTKLLNKDEEDGSGNSNRDIETGSSTILDKAEETTDNPGFPEPDKFSKVHWNSSSDIGYTGGLEKDEDNTSAGNGTANQDNLKINYTETSGREEDADSTSVRKNNSSTDYKEKPGKDKFNAANPKKNLDNRTDSKNISNKNKNSDKSSNLQKNVDHINDITKNVKSQKGHSHTSTINGKVKTSRKVANRQYIATVRQKYNKYLRNKAFQEDSSGGSDERFQAGNDSSQSSGSDSDSDSRSNSDQSN